MILKCKMCGGDLNASDEAAVCRCPYCGTNQTIPRIDSEKKAKLYERAERLRRSCDFDAAARVYESAVSDFPDDPEAYWGLVLCKYGIEYVDDETKKKVPTCHRLSFDIVLENDDLKNALSKADPIARRIYREEAEAIEAIRAKAVALLAGRKGYDVFICYKETDAYGRRTEDSVIAQSVYEMLSAHGYRVFFSRITLESALGEDYEPLIFAALSTVRIMLVIGTRSDFLMDTWVRNEWSRYLRFMEEDKTKVLIPCYKGITPHEMPRELSRLQGQDLGKLGYEQDLLRGIGKLMPSAKSVIGVDAVAGPGTSSAMVQRGNMALEDAEFDVADSFFERALDANPFDGYAYLGKFLVSNRAKSLDELSGMILSLEDDRNFQRALKFADSNLVELLRNAIAANEANIVAVRKREEKEHAELEESRMRFSEMKREAFFKLFENPEASIDCLGNAFIDGREHCSSRPTIQTDINLMLAIAKSLAATLRGRDVFDKAHLYQASKIGMEKPDVADGVLHDLMEFGLVERTVTQHGTIFGLPGAWGEFEERRKAEAKRKAAQELAEREYRNACDTVEAEIQAELASVSAEIEARYAPDIAVLRNEMGAANSAAMQRKVELKMAISQLQTHRAALGLFDKQQKLEIERQIVVLNAQIDSIATSEQMQADYIPKIDTIIERQNQEIRDAEHVIRARHPMPKRSAYDDSKP